MHNAYAMGIYFEISIIRYIYLKYIYNKCTSASANITRGRLLLSLVFICVPVEGARRNGI